MRGMTPADAERIVRRRLRAQRLSGTPFASPVEAVGWFVAVQAQDWPAAAWAIGQRSRSASAASIDSLLGSGALLRTHLLRPTWHAVLPEDVRPLLALSGRRVRRSQAARRRELGIDDEALLSRAEAAFAEALRGGQQLTRAQLAEVLTAAGIDPGGQRLPHLLLVAEADQVVISGGRRGRQLTWALFAERVAPQDVRPETDLVRELAVRYMRSRGPATLDDFAWWSGLPASQARRGLEAAGKELREEAIGGVGHWSHAGAGTPRGAAQPAHLLPNFDEYTVAYRDRSAVLHPGRPHDPGIFGFGSILSNAVYIGGRLAGAWRRTQAGAQLSVEVRLLGRVSPAEEAAIAAAAERYGAFHGRPVELRIH